MSSSTSNSDAPAGSSARLAIPDERVPASSPRLLLGIAAQVAVLLALLNFAALVVLEHRTPNRAHFLIREKWEMLARLDAPHRSLILGDSTCNQAVVPAQLEAAVGGHWVNLCTVADLVLLDDAWMLERYIERNGPPQRVLLMHAYDTWPRELDVQALASVPLPWGFWSQHTPSQNIELGSLDNLLLARFAPLYAAHWSLAELLRNPSTLLRPPFQLDASGFMAGDPSAPDYVHTDAAGYLDRIGASERALSAVNREALQHMVSLAETHGFDLHLANGPVWEELAESPVFRAHYAQVSAELRRITSGSQRTSLLLEGPVPVPIAGLSNADHVTASAARRYTEQLARSLKPQNRHAVSLRETPAQLEGSSEGESI